MRPSSSRPDTVPGQRPAVATACGKVILLGEHSVVYGEPAVAVPLTQMRLSVVLAKAEPQWPVGAGDSGPIRPPSPRGGPLEEMPTLQMPAVSSSRPGALSPDSGPPTLEAAAAPPLTIDLADGSPDSAHADVSRALGAAARTLGLELPLPLRVAVRTGGLRSGMGTSAALGTAISRALLAWYGYPPDVARVLPAAGAVEALFHNNPSGIDHTVSAREVPVWFEKDMAPIALEGLAPIDLVLLPRASDRSTAELVDGVRERLVADPTLVRVVAEMGRWSRDGRAAWSAGDLDGLAEAMKAQQGSLQKLGVVNDEDLAGIRAATDAGALAAKITGAGWGGTLLALVRPEQAASVAAAWGEGTVTLRIG